MFLLLRGVNKANNPRCQGQAKDLQRIESEERKIERAEKRQMSDLLTPFANCSQRIERLLVALCATDHRGKDRFRDGNVFFGGFLAQGKTDEIIGQRFFKAQREDDVGRLDRPSRTSRTAGGANTLQIKA